MFGTTSALQQFLIRVFAGIVVVLVTYNPTGWLSYVHWVSEGFETDMALKALAGLVLLIAYVVLIRATYYAIGVIGIVLVAALIAAIVWVMSDLGVLAVRDPGVLSWVILIGIGVLLGVGLSWAIIRRRLSGQVSTDELGPDGGPE